MSIEHRPFWHDLPELDQLIPDVLGELQARTDAALARHRDDRGALVVIDPQAADAWLASERADEAREYDPAVA